MAGPLVFHQLAGPRRALIGRGSGRGLLESLAVAPLEPGGDGLILPLGDLGDHVPAPHLLELRGDVVVDGDDDDSWEPHPASAATAAVIRTTRREI